MERLDYNLRFRWLAGLSMDEPMGDATVFSQNHERLLEGEVAHAFFDQMLTQARARDLRSDEDCTVDGTLIDAWAGQKKFTRKEAAPSLPPDDPDNPSICDGSITTLLRPENISYFRPTGAVLCTLVAMSQARLAKGSS
jgi:Transposase domain (DUF772)